MNIDKYLVTYKTVKDMNLQELISFTDSMFRQYDDNFYVSNTEELIYWTYSIIGHNKNIPESNYTYKNALEDLVSTYPGIFTFLQENYISYNTLKYIEEQENKEEYIDVTFSLTFNDVSMIKYYPCFDKVLILVNNPECSNKPLIARMSLNQYEQLLLDAGMGLHSILNVIKQGKEERNKYPFARLLALGLSDVQTLMFLNMMGERINNLEDEDIFNLLKLKETLKRFNVSLNNTKLLDNVKPLIEELSDYHQQCEYIKHKLQGYKE